MPLIDPPPSLPENASPGQREMHARAEEQFLTEGGRVVSPERGEDATSASLRALQENHRRFLTHHQPITAALQLAAMRTVEELEARATSTSVPAIIAMGEAMVRKAVAGDVQAYREIAERLEGKPGNRRGDIDPEAEERRALMATTIEATVRALTEGKRAQTLDAEVTEVTE